MEMKRMSWVLLLGMTFCLGWILNANNDNAAGSLLAQPAFAGEQSNRLNAVQLPYPIVGQDEMMYFGDKRYGNNEYAFFVSYQDNKPQLWRFDYPNGPVKNLSKEK